MKFSTILPLLLFVYVSSFAQNSKRWNLQKDGSINWQIKPGDTGHTDHIEMSGLQVSAIVNYGIDAKGALRIKKKLVFPMLRTIPNNTHASLIENYDDNDLLSILVDEIPLKEFPTSFSLKGKIIVNSKTNTGLTVTRTIFPSINKPALLEIIQLKNSTQKAYTVSISNNLPAIETDASKGVYGQYIISADTKDTGTHIIAAGDVYDIAVSYNGRKLTDEQYAYSAAFELKKRDEFVKSIFNNLILETPNDTINSEFAFAKIRATESIYDTKGGLMHGPGGGSYYAAIWANDQAEYASPFFPYLGNVNGNESAINCYRHFARFINPEYKPIPSSIIAEGVDIWNGAGDRGDMAMIAFGASQFALAYGDMQTAKELWPLIQWCLAYLETQKTSDGVIRSNSDELEGRFPAGKINLSTNSLSYGGYINAAYLADALHLTAIANDYRDKAKQLRSAIEKYFGANVQGYDTYKYYAENTRLRAWICLPLVMGITERKRETIKALFSPYLWSVNGILTESGDSTFWDRATLYAFRGLFANGETDACIPYFNYYSATRLLGEHVPYPVEAWPEGNQRHLSAESALYCRAVTEGLFGIKPVGLNEFTITPWLPEGWNYMRLKNVQAFNHSFDIDVAKKDSGEMVTIRLKNGKLIQKYWDKKAGLHFILPE